jgi:hypothetical protein
MADEARRSVHPGKRFALSRCPEREEIDHPDAPKRYSDGTVEAIKKQLGLK